MIRKPASDVLPHNWLNTIRSARITQLSRIDNALSIDPSSTGCRAVQVWGQAMHRSTNVIAAVGLALGGALGMAGAMVTQQNVQAILWAIDAVGIVMASALLTVKYLRTGNDVVAAGFLILGIGEGVLLSGTAAGP